MVGSGRTAGLEVHVVSIQLVRSAVVVGPAVVVAGGVGPDHAELGQLVQGLGVGGVFHIACHGGAQRQVDGVGADGHGVFDGGHVVGVVSAAALAEDLHDQQLSVGSFALGVDSLKSLVKAFAVGDVLVGGGNAGHVRAVLALGVIVVGDVQIHVHVVHSVGDLLVEVGHVGAVDERGGVQLIPHSRNVGVGHQPHGGLAGLIQFINGILEAGGVEGLVVRVKAGIHNGDGAAGAGVTQVPGLGRAGHLGSNDVVHLILSGVVTQLDDNVLNADDVADGFDLVILHIGGDDVGS